MADEREKSRQKWFPEKSQCDYCWIGLKETSVLILKCVVPGKKIRPSNAS